MMGQAMNAAVIKNGVVINIIVTDLQNFNQFNAHGWNLIDGALLGIAIGDTTTDNINFFRDGQRLPITFDEQPAQPVAEGVM